MVVICKSDIGCVYRSQLGFCKRRVCELGGNPPVCVFLTRGRPEQPVYLDGKRYVQEEKEEETLKVQMKQ